MLCWPRRQVPGSALGEAVSVQAARLPGNNAVGGLAKGLAMAWREMGQDAAKVLAARESRISGISPSVPPLLPRLAVEVAEFAGSAEASRGKTVPESNSI